jgi:hypothetical protein
MPAPQNHRNTNPTTPTPTAPPSSPHAGSTTNNRPTPTPAAPPTTDPHPRRQHHNNRPTHPRRQNHQQTITPMPETPLINPYTHAGITNFQKPQIQNHFIPTNQIKHLQTADARSPHDAATCARARKRVRDFQRREERGSCAAVSGGGGGGEEMREKERIKNG